MTAPGPELELKHALDAFRADLVLENARCYTMNPSQPVAEAVAVTGGRITAVGERRTIDQFCGPDTRRIDLGGRTLLPGFVESHNHVSAYSHIVLQVDCMPRTTQSIAQIVERVAERVRTQPPGTWIEGYGYDNSALEEQRFVTRHDLDAVSPDHPVHLWHISGHFTTLNSCALKLCGIDRDTPDPEGGKIVRDENGEPTGVLEEMPAMLIPLRLIPQKTEDEKVEGLRIVSDEYVAAGVTSTHDANLGVYGGLGELNAFRRAQAEKKFRPRVYALVWTVLEKFRDAGVDLDEMHFSSGAGDEWLKLGAIKLFVDGSIPGLTAALTEPYHCDPEEKGFLIFSPEQLHEIVSRYHDAGFQIAFHANGDHCIGTVIEAVAEALERTPRADHRHRIEHLPMASEAHLDRMAEIGMTTTFYTAQIYGWGDRQRERFLGPERAERLYPTKSALDRGIPFGLHGDCPVTPISPLHCLYTAVARETSGGHILGPDQRIDVDTALRALTIDGAYLAFEENIKGSIERGKLADFVVLSEDPHDLEPTELQRLEVDMTIIDGEVVYERS